MFIILSVLIYLLIGVIIAPWLDHIFERFEARPSYYDATFYVWTAFLWPLFVLLGVGFYLSMGVKKVLDKLNFGFVADYWYLSSPEGFRVRKQDKEKSKG